MLNGGSDCCGTCWFNSPSSKTEAAPGYSKWLRVAAVPLTAASVHPKPFREGPFTAGSDSMSSLRL